MKKLALILTALLLAVSLAACGNSENESEANNGAAEEQNNAAVNTGNGSEESGSGEGAEEPSQATVYPLTITDSTGTELTFEQAPQRIVSTSPSETEILFALGLNDRIVGVSDYDNYPAEALEKPKVGGVVEPNEEAILVAEADLVVGGISLQPEAAEQLRASGLKLFKFEPKKVQDVLDNIMTIGQITDRQAEAEALVAQMESDIRKVTEAVSGVAESEKKKVLIEFSLGWTVGSGEFMDELITMAGGVNIAAAAPGWNPINEEQIIEQNPDVILFTKEETDPDSGKSLEQTIKERSAWSEITAIKENQLVGLERDVLSRPGPRITQGLQAIAEGLYPDLVQP